jgi:hypothetical protein
MRPSLGLGAVLTALLTGCDRPAGGGTMCGLAALAGPTSLLGEFGVPRQTLGSAPEQLPERLVVRFVAGPSVPAVVGRADSLWIVGAEGAPPAGTMPGYGVLVLDPSRRARGVMVYEGTPVEGAPRIGTVSVGAASVPLIGIQVDPARFEDPRCPFFPDSVLK